MSRKTKADLRNSAVKTANTRKAIKPVERGIFDNVTMSDVLGGFSNKMNTKREAKTNANGLRWSVNRLRFN